MEALDFSAGLRVIGARDEEGVVLGSLRVVLDARNTRAWPAPSALVTFTVVMPFTTAAGQLAHPCSQEPREPVLNPPRLAGEPAQPLVGDSLVEYRPISPQDVDDSC